MKSAKSIRRKSSVSGPFTPAGKRGSCHRHARWIAAAAGSLLATPLPAEPQTGPTSSATVGISVSVAPSFTLASSEPRLEELDTLPNYCIATNGEPMALPVLLVQANSGDGIHQQADLLPWCGAGQGQREGQARADDRKPAGLVFIRPE